MDFKEVCCNIRSCLNSSKSQLSLTQLLRDYKEVLGEPLPFRPLGYNSAEALLRAVPNLRISNLRGEVFIDVKPDEKTAHIASLVREQRNSKKKKRKPIRGYQRGGAPLPPLRRPASIPPPRRSAPPPRDRSDYYPSYRRTSPPNQSYQRKPSPPRYTSYSNNSNNRNENYTNSRNENYSNSRNDNYSNNRNDNNYQRRRDSPPSTFTSQQNYRNSAPIEISSDEDNNFNNRNDQAKRVEEEIRRKYCPVPSQYNFSDSNEYNDDDGSDLEDCDEINSKMEELKVTLGNQRQVSINKPKFRSYPSNTSNEDDYGYSSMNEINASTKESPQGDAVSKGKGDMKEKMNLTRSPGALLAAGRAMQEPNITSTSNSKVRLKDLKPLPPHQTHSFIQKYLSKNSSTHGDAVLPSVPAPNPKPADSREPFRTLNRSDSINSNGSRPSPASSPVDKVNPSLPPSSKMCDLNMFQPSRYVEPDFSDGTSCGKLLEFTACHNLQPPQFKTFVKFIPKSKVASYMCKIKVGSSLSYTSFPFESGLVSDVQEYTAKIALKELEKRYGTVNSTDLPVTDDENLIIQRIAEIVNPHSSGLKSETIETKYKNAHQQILPLDWLDLIKNRSLLSVEELVGGSIAVYPVEGGMTGTHLDVSKLPPLVLPESEVWNVYITCCDSTSSVYFRIVHDDYNGAYVGMDEKMHELYNAKRDSEELRHVEVVKEGSYYAAYLDSDWFRVKALSTIVDGLVKVCLIDHGDIDEVTPEELFPLDERFTAIPAQKVSCSLTGLEKYSKEPYVTGLVYQLTYGKTFVAKVDTRNPSLQLTLLDTSTDDDIIVNDLIGERIEKELEPPKVPSKNNVTDAYLVSVKEDGSACVQIYSDSFLLLKSFLDEASEEIATNLDTYQVKSTNELLGSRIFLARYAADGKWYRVIIDKVVNEEQIEVLFVDYGCLEVVTLNDIADSKHFAEALSIMPNQAIQVRLVKPNEELFTDNVTNFLMDLASPKESNEPTRFLLKTVKEGAIPDVYLFFRMKETNQLVNVNDIIGSYFPQFRGPNHISINLSTETLERVAPVPMYVIPSDVKEQFGVYVTMVSSPFNFIVQPQADAAKLAELKSLMKSFYDKEEACVDVSNIKENEIYAVKNVDGMWYRGMVMTLMKAYNNITIKLIDYGEIITIPHSNIAQLLPAFRQLSRQAIKAELAGVTPLHGDWCVDDSLRFKQLVSEKMLISFVVSVLDDGKISIILFDTSADDAIDIGAVLINEGRAKDITQH
ncbi:tudor domain-containing protein 7B-like isoform X2 [Planococcus citri]|uniref:tudor domain-containing protein 7B-like isoform X2 n=1 Tax=Planococcus citri TaxID=170843 RepID=UPI0031F829A9